MEGCLALARASLKEALLVPGEGAAVQGPVLVGDLLLGLLLTQLWARGATVSPRGIIIVEQCVALVEADASLGRLLTLIQIFSVRSLTHWSFSRWWWWSYIATRDIRVSRTRTLIWIVATRLGAGIPRRGLRRCAAGGVTLVLTAA